MKSTRLPCKSLRADTQYIQNSCHLPPSKKDNTVLFCLFNNLSCFSHSSSFHLSLHTGTETVSSLLKDWTHIFPNKLTQTFSSGGKIKKNQPQTTENSVGYMLLLSTFLFWLSDRCQRWQVTTLNFVFKALTVHWFYLRHWIYKGNELQYCPCYHRPITLLEMSSLIIPGQTPHD